LRDTPRACYPRGWLIEGGGTETENGTARRTHVRALTATARWRHFALIDAAMCVRPGRAELKVCPAG